MGLSKPQVKQILEVSFYHLFILSLNSAKESTIIPKNIPNNIKLTKIKNNKSKKNLPVNPYAFSSPLNNI